MELWPVIILITAFAVFMALRYKTAKDRLDFLEQEDPEDVNEQTVKNKIIQFLKSLNINFTEDHSEKSKIFTVEYQNAQFLISYAQCKENFIELVFPSIYKEKIDYIDSIRSFCNYTNSLDSRIFAIYVTEADTAYVNLSTTIPASISSEAMKMEFTRLTAECFSMQRNFIAALESHIETSKSYEASDMEYDYCCNEKLKGLLHETTITLNNQKTKFSEPYLRGEKDITLQILLHHLNFAENVSFDSLEVHAGDYHFNTEESGKIAHYPLITPLLGDWAECPDIQAFKYQDAVLILHYSYPKSTDEPDERTALTLYVMLHAGSAMKDTLYYRLTYSFPQYEAGHISAANSSASLEHPVSGSMLLAYDLKTESQQLAEFRFMWGDLKDKLNEGKKGELTPEQATICYIVNPNIAYHVYWGKKLMRKERFMEAAIRLEWAWNMFNNVFERLKKNERSKFYEISYLISVCLYKLNMPERALFYLHVANETENVNYFCMQVRCMIAANDPCALKHLENSLKNTERQISKLKADEEDIPDNLSKLYTFLRRSKVLLFIERGYFEQAEKLCKNMLNEKENADFALKTLRALKHYKDIQSENL